MKQLIIDKIDRLVKSGEVVDKDRCGYKIGMIYAYIDSDYFPDFRVENTDLDFCDSKEVYNHLQSIFKQQFIKYLKED